IVYGTAGRPLVRLLSSSPEAGAHFGWSLAVGRGTLAVGAPHEDADGAEDSGAVHLFEVGAGHGEGRRISQDTPGVPGSGEPGDMFGWSVAVGRMGGLRDAVDLAVGAPYDNDDGTGRQEGGGGADTGSIAVVFDVSGAKDVHTSRKWDLRRIVETHPGDRFGYAMAYAEEGDVGYLAVGAPLGDGGGVRDSGLVRLFRSSATEEITPLTTLGQGAKGAPGDGYGFSLALTGEG
ncbi:FG-GAP repeat protein, partial [Streptosporangium algeriense]